jgi:hypothetical protein
MKWQRFGALVGVAAMAIGLSGCWIDGPHIIGLGSQQVAPGLYTTTRPYTGTSTRCSWFRVDKNGKVLGSDFEYAGRSFIQIRPTDYEAFTKGCGVWVPPQSGSYNPFNSTAKYGAYRVNVDLRPGTYSAPGGPNCSWTRLSSFDGSPQSTIAASFDPNKPFTPAFNPKVTIKSTDVGFLSDICGGWKRVGP